jgi:surface polysaccharide O-acyltransferase-like enzyme
MTVQVVVPGTHSVGSRLTWADFCSVCAIFGVIVIHASVQLLSPRGKIPLDEWLVSANIVDSMVRCSVPIFVMLSGALILKRDVQKITLSEVWRRVLKVLVPLFSWSVAYLFYISYYTGGAVDFLSILVKPSMYHLWFVYMIIGVYILSPLYQVMFNSMLNNGMLKFYLLGLWFLVCSVPVYFSISALNLLGLNGLFAFGGYFLLGGIIASSEIKVPSVVLVLVFVLSVFATALLTFFYSSSAGILVERAYQYFSPNVVLSSVVVFILFSRAKVSPRMAKVSHWVGDRSFIVFFVHIVFLGKLSDSAFFQELSRMIPVPSTIMLLSVVTFLISLTLASLIRLIPKSRMFLG